jgi:hypothetical protein
VNLMAGFDLIIEISNRALLNLIKTYMRFGNTPVNPPFDVNIPFGNDNAHLVIENLQLDLNADDTVTLSMSFDTASVTVNEVGQTVCPLDGSITVTAPIGLADSSLTPNAKVVAIDLGGATSVIDLSPGSMAKINALVFGFGSVVVNQATAELTKYITGFKLQKFEQVGFPVKPGADGSIDPPQFEQLEVHCLHGADRDHQALGAFGILLLGNHGHGDHTQRAGTAIVTGEDFAVSIAPGAFHSLVFCRGLAAFFGTTVDNLPTSCGSAGGISVPGGNGAQLTHCDDGLADGGVVISGTLHKSGFCYDAHGTFSASVQLGVAGNTLTVQTSIPQTSTSVDIPWYCWLGAALGLGPIGLISVGIADGIAQGMASDIANAARKLGTFSTIAAIEGFGPASIGRLAITTDGITMAGAIALSTPWPTARSLLLTGSVVASSTSTLGSGTYTSDHCPVGDWPFTEYANQQAGTYVVTAKLLAEPLSLEWFIYTWGPNGVIETQPLLGDQGKVNLVVPNCYYPQPLGSGGTNVTQTVEVGFQTMPDGIVLTNRPSDGNFAFVLGVTATDCMDNVFTAETDVAFTGDTVSIGGGFQQAVWQCIKLLVDRLRVEKLGTPGGIGIEFWPPVNYPAPEQLQAFIRALASVGSREADQAIVSTILAHGTSFNRAINAISLPHSAGTFFGARR